MADYLVSALVETIVGTLTSVSLQEIGLLWGLKDELDSLESTFTTLQLVLQDAEIKQWKSEPIQNWLMKLKDVAYDVDNILDEMATESLKRKMGSKEGMSFNCLTNPLKFKFEMAHKVKNIREKLSSIADQRLKFHLGEGVMENRFGMTWDSRQTISLVIASEIYGREGEKERMVEKLLDDRRGQDDLVVYAICGMGGLGKTTLAQLVFNDERIKRHFELRIWVCVSDDFNIQRLVIAIIESIDEGFACKISNQLDPLQRHLREKLKGKRFLLVLDDVWNENPLLWDRLKDILRCDLKGNVLVATTRNEKVASMMATTDVHRIGCLTEEDSWSLFKQRAFSSNDVEERLVSIGRAIVKKCGGVPLAIKALGSLMQFKSGESEWLAIKESEIWELSDDEIGILPALRLSYDNLLPHMRQCFAYCCLFPKDYEMDEDMLIQLWMANGFIPSVGQRDLFLAGRLIFKELTWRSFFQDIKINSGIIRCKMHDLMHDLAISVMRHETHVLEQGKKQYIPRAVRHLSIDQPIESKLSLQFDGSLRSFVMGTDFYFKVSLLSFLSRQQYIRAFHMSQSRIKNCHNLVCKMEQLRYLCMSCHSLKRLPESLTHLYNLQTLKLLSASQLVKLPKDMKVMKHLCFLELDSFVSLLSTPSELGELTLLRKLSIFIVGQGGSQQINQLKELNLGGELTIKGLEHVQNLEDAKSANLVEKMNLIGLCLRWTRDIRSNSPEHFEEVLQGLQPHQNLEKIRIDCYQGSKIPNWMSSLAFQKLEEIWLLDCPRLEVLPTLGKLPRLRLLFLCGMDSMKQLGAEWHGDAECSFPALTDLEIRSMSNLEEWCLPDSVESFPCLTSLSISGCPKLDEVPFLPSLKNLTVYHRDAALVPSIMRLPSLKSLTLDLSESDCLPRDSIQRHMALERLHVQGSGVKTLCGGILDNLSSLKELCFQSCPSLEFVPDGIRCLNSLKWLSFLYCDALTSFSATTLEHLSSLEILEFQNCKKLKPLLGPLNGGTALRSLVMNGLPELDYFPESIGQLESLSELTIMYCEKLKSLPHGFEALEKLYIRHCLQLEKRCKKPDGEDWPKISHIPYINIIQSK